MVVVGCSQGVPLCFCFLFHFPPLLLDKPCTVQWAQSLWFLSFSWNMDRRRVASFAPSLSLFPLDSSHLAMITGLGRTPSGGCSALV